MEYREIKALSQSSLKLLDQSPKYFYDTVERWLIGEIELPQDDPSSAQIVGDMVDIRLTKSLEELTNKYSSVTNAPTGQMLDFVNESYRLIKLGVNPKEAAQQAYNTVGIKRDSLEKMMERFKIEGKLYYDSLVRAENKKVVPDNYFSLSERMVNDLREDRFTSKYVNQVSDFNIEVYHQVELQYEIGGVETKGMIDKLIIDHKAKTILPIDYKTSSEANFRKSFIQYRYDIQAALYTELVREGYPIFIKLDGYELLPFMFIVCFSIQRNPEVWIVSENDLRVGREGGVRQGIVYKGYEQLIEDYKWHKHTGQWKYKKEVYDNQGVRILDCYDE